MIERLFPDLPRFRGVFRLLCVESAFAVAYDTWVGPTYLSGLAGELKLDLTLVSVLAAVPFIGASGQILGAWAFERSTSVKRYVLGIATIGRGLWLLPLVLAAIWGARSRWGGVPFPVKPWFVIAAFSACLSSLLTSASMNAWLYWMRTLVPARFQGRFFGGLQRSNTLAFVIASVIAASLVGWKLDGYRLGMGVICLMAMISGTISVWFHSRVEDVPVERPVNGRPRTFREIVAGPLQDRNFRKLLLFGASFNGAMQLALSYLPYYFTSELHVPMSSVVLWGGLSSVGCFLASGFWGKRLDRVARPADVLWYTGHFCGLTLFLYAFARNSALVQVIAPIEYLVGGMCWAGFILAQTKSLFAATPQGKGGSYFSVYAAACGLSGAGCTFLAGHLVNAAGFRTLWFVAIAARVAVLWLFCRPLRQRAAAQVVARVAARVRPPSRFELPAAEVPAGLRSVPNAPGATEATPAGA